MDQPKVYRVKTNPPDTQVAIVIVAFCKEDENYYAEYLVLCEDLRCKGCRLWHDSFPTGEAEAARILQYAFEMAMQRMTSEGLGQFIIEKQYAFGDESDVDSLRIRHPAELKKIYAKVKCQCMKDLLNHKKMR